MIEKNFKRDLVDSLEELPLLGLEEPQKLRLVNLRTELRMLSVPLELLQRKVLCQEEVSLFFMLPRNWITLKELTLIKILVLKLLEKPARSHARPSAQTLVSKDQSLLTNF